MVRRRRATSKRRRRRRGARRQRVLTNAPPRLSITSNTRRINISYGYSVTDEVKRYDITFAKIFAFGPNSGLPFQYRECKVHTIKVYWQSDNATSDAGSVCLNVEDYGENTGTDTCAFEELLSYPGSMTRKVWQNVSNIWFPTEPSDREYHDILSADGIFTVTVRHSVSGSKLKGRISCLLTVSVRGRSILRKAALDVINNQTMVDNMDMVMIGPTYTDDPK